MKRGISFMILSKLILLFCLRLELTSCVQGLELRTYREMEEKIEARVRRNGSLTEFNSDDCDKLIDRLENNYVSVGKVEKASEGIAKAEATEIEANLAFGQICRGDLMKTQKCKDFQKGIQDYVFNSGNINWFSRSGQIGDSADGGARGDGAAQKRLDDALDAVRKEATRRRGHNYRITYRINIWKPDGLDAKCGSIPYSPQGFRKEHPQIICPNQNEIIGDLAYLSSSQHLQYVTGTHLPLGAGKIEDSTILARFILMSQSGTPIGIEGIKTSNAKENKDWAAAVVSKLKGKNKSEWNTLLAFKNGNKKPKAGEGEILFGRGTVFKVLKIKASKGNTNQVYVCAREDPNGLRSHRKMKNSKSMQFGTDLTVKDANAFCNKEGYLLKNLKTC